MNVKSLKSSMETFSFCALVVYLLDIIVLGKGIVTSYGLWSSRTLFSVAVLVSALPKMYEQRKRLLKNRYIYLFGSFVAWTLILAVIDLCKGSSLYDVIYGYSQYSTLLLFPAVLVILDSKEKVGTMLKFLFFGCVAITALTGVLLLLGFLPENIGLYLQDRFSLYGICKIDFFGMRKMGVYFFTGTPYLSVGVLTGVYFAASKEKPNIIAVIASGFMTAALFMSCKGEVSVATIGAFLLSMIMIVYLSSPYLGRVIKCVSAIALIAAVLVIIYSFLQGTNIFLSAVEHFGEFSKYNDNYLNVYGGGFSSTPEGLLYKTGILGGLLFALPFVIALFDTLSAVRDYTYHTGLYYSLMVSGSSFMLVLSILEPAANITAVCSFYMLAVASIAKIYDRSPENDLSKQL